MSKLADLLKQKVVKPQRQPKVEKLVEKKVVTKPEPVGTPQTSLYEISDEDLAKVRASVQTINMTGKTRQEIIIGMYGSIKDPQTGKRFVIPGIDFMTENYVYKYAEMMRTLVDKPEAFEKIMNWE